MRRGQVWLSNKEESVSLFRCIGGKKGKKKRKKKNFSFIIIIPKALAANSEDEGVPTFSLGVVGEEVRSVSL